LLVRSPDILPLPFIDDSKVDTTRYLKNALQQAMHTTGAFVSSIRELTTSHSHAFTTLRATPDGSYILSHAKKDKSSQHTNFGISLEDQTAYAMLATLTNPVKTRLNTSITIRDQTKQ
jgi:hypothetical protein